MQFYWALYTQCINMPSPGGECGIYYQLVQMYLYTGEVRADTIGRPCGSSETSRGTRPDKAGQFEVALSGDA